MQFQDGAELVGSVRRRDPEAIRWVLETYLPQLVRVARGAGLDESAADDVVQETFVTFLEKIGEFEGRSRVRTWLFGILYRKIQEARRAAHREQAVDDIEAIFDARFDRTGRWSRPPVEADAEAYNEQVRTHLEACLERLPEQQRMVFLLRDVEEMDSHQICNILNVTRTNMGVLLFRARNHLKECLESKGVQR